MNLYRQRHFICLPERNGFDSKQSFDANATGLVRVLTGRIPLTVDLFELATVKQGNHPAGPTTNIIPTHTHKTFSS
jgi:hypothetical protein